MTRPVRCPVLFIVQWDDELFPRTSALELYDALGSSDKRLHAYPGRHGSVPAEAFDASEQFLLQHVLPRIGGGTVRRTERSGHEQLEPIAGGTREIR